jgi:hypothetical protein
MEQYDWINITISNQLDAEGGAYVPFQRSTIGQFQIVNYFPITIKSDVKICHSDLLCFNDMAFSLKTFCPN